MNGKKNRFWQQAAWGNAAAAEIGGKKIAPKIFSLETGEKSEWKEKPVWQQAAWGSAAAAETGGKKIAPKIFSLERKTESANRKEQSASDIETKNIRQIIEKALKRNAIEPGCRKKRKSLAY